MKRTVCLAVLAVLVIFTLSACNNGNTSASKVSDNSKGNTLRASLDGQNIKGQDATCGKSPSDKVFNIDVFEKTLNLGMGFKTTTWTYGEGMPGPLMEACVGDKVTINLKNNTDVTHGLDSHAFKISAAEYGHASFTGVLDTPGVFMYHCASGPTTDLHIKSGMGGAMVVYPRDYKLRSAKEMVVVQGALFGDPDKTGFIGRDTKRMMDNNPFSIMFNGTLEHKPVKVSVGDLVRLYFVNMGPGTSAVHVIGTMLDRFYQSGNPNNLQQGAQTESVPPGGGAIVEFYVPTSGAFIFVDHDNLRHLSYGAALPFTTDASGAPVAGH